MKNVTKAVKSAVRAFPAAVLLLFPVSSLRAQIELLPQQKMKKWDVPAGNYSGITPIGGNRYAVVSDKQEEDGFYEFEIVQNPETGKVERAEMVCFHAAGSPARDAEGITFFPDSSTVFISAEDDQKILEYGLDGVPTGRSLAVPDAFSLDSIYGNYGFEALGFSGETGLFWTCTENSLRSDGVLPTADNPVPARLRLQSFGKDLLPAGEYPYLADRPRPGRRHKKIVAGVPEILPLGDGRLLVLEREVLVTSNNIGNRVDSRIYLFSPGDSVKTLQAAWSTRLNLTRRSIANYEGMCMGARLEDGRRTVLVVSDAQNGAGNALFRLKDYIRVGVLDGDSLALLSTDGSVAGVTAPRDTTAYIPKLERVLSNRWVQTAYTGGALVAAGLLVKSHARHFRSLRNDYTPRYKASADDYLQYSPMVVSYLLKFAGVPGRSPMGKRLTASVFSFAIVNLVSNGLKEAVSVARPDGSGRNSMPSNHTAGAFMSATMLYKEYGSYSPWVGFSAYGMAAVTGVMRMMRNKHWISDVLVGSGIGIMGAEVGYWISDLLFPSCPGSFDSASAAILDDSKKPHFIGAYAGFYVPLKNFGAGPDRSLRQSNGATMGIEGAYFLTRNVGFGAQAGISDISYNDADGCLTDCTTRFYSVKAGCYLACAVHPRVSLGARVLCGCTVYPGNKSNIVDGGGKCGPCALGGVSLSLRAKERLVFRLGADYEVMPSPSSELSALQALLLSGGAVFRF